jgi:ABC-type transport system involved in multi-copper enzyme maturation permease subunit
VNAVVTDPMLGAVIVAVVRRQAHGGRIIGLFLILVIIVVVVVLLMQRRRDRKPIDDTQPLSHAPLAPREQVVTAQSASLADARALRGTEVAPRAVARAARTLPSGRYGLSGVIKSEWTKLRSVRSTMWTLGITVVLGIGISALVTWQTQSHWSTMSVINQQTFDPAQTSLVGLFIGQFAIGVLGALVLSAEYGTGTIRATFAAAPRRPMVLVAKAAVFGAVALVVAEVVAFVAFFLGQALLSAPATHATLSTPGALRQVVGSGLYIAVLGLFALGLAAIIRHTAGAICAYLGVILMLPIIIQFLPNSIQFDVRRFLPDRIGSAMISATGDPHLFSPWIGLLLLCGYSAAVLVVGGVMLVRRDA